MPLRTAFHRLSFPEKVAVVTSVVQTPVVVVGVVFGLQQLRLASRAFRIDHLARTYEALEQYESATEEAFAYCYHDFLATRAFAVSTSPKAGELDTLLARNKFSTSIDRVLQSARDISNKEKTGLVDRSVTYSRVASDLRSILARMDRAKSHSDLGAALELEHMLVEDFLLSYSTWIDRVLWVMTH